ncbi:MAG: polysaccharide deacetylase family protein [Armatimonadota bacterium]|nr:polysaccharide deacetylase family protein [bacterium]
MHSKPSQAGVPVVLLYHRIGFPKLSSLVAGQYVAPPLFRSQMGYLTARGWTVASLDSVISDRQPASNMFAVTFDDGYLSVYEHAFPIMVERGIKATIYVVADAVGGLNDWDRKAGDQAEPMMSAAQIREMADAGFEIGSHTLTHPHLTECDDDELRREIVDSKRKLEDIIGRQVSSFSYPYGDCDQRVIAAAKDAGYCNAVSTKLGVVRDCGVFEIPRVNVRWNAFGPLLARKIERAKRASGL